MDKIYLGLDIGGTKCAAVAGRCRRDGFDVLAREQIPTNPELGRDQSIERLFQASENVIRQTGAEPAAVGISCGGPLNSRTGRVLSPPNLPGWDDVPICDLAAVRFGVPAYLQNDANACALAEWRFGAGRGCRNMVFLTFGTGMGAGLILNGRLYDGASGMAGEVGHIRLAETGPMGYGKRGSFEGFCSGGGIARAAADAGRTMTAREAAEAARAGDPAAMEVFAASARYLGRGLSLLMDLLDPERIVIGSIFARCGDLYREPMEAEIRREALEACRADCEIVPAGLGEEIGDWAALCVAAYGDGEMEA